MRFAFIALALVGMVCSCALPGQMQAGTIYSQNGRVLQFHIETAFHTGTVDAYDPQKQEKFTGSYVAISEQDKTNVAAFGTSGYLAGSATTSSNMANARFYLQGNKGDLLTCQINIQASLFTPHGVGTCTDNHGQNYAVQF